MSDDYERAGRGGRARRDIGRSPFENRKNVCLGIGWPRGAATVVDVAAAERPIRARCAVCGACVRRRRRRDTVHMTTVHIARYTRTRSVGRRGRSPRSKSGRRHGAYHRTPPPYRVRGPGVAITVARDLLCRTPGAAARCLPACLPAPPSTAIHTLVSAAHVTTAARS